MKKLTLAMLSLASLGVLVLAGCAEAEDAGDVEPTGETEEVSTDVDNETAEDEAETEVVAFTNDEGQLLCPVMGTAIESEEDAVSYQDYERKRYYFCCAACPDQFAAEPEKFAEGAALDV